MTNNLMKLMPTYCLLLATVLAIFGGTANGATIFADGDDTVVAVNDGAFFDGTDSTTSSAFSTPELIKNQGDETKTSDATPLTTVPFITYLGNHYLQLIYDQQETANTTGQPNRERVILTQLSVYVSPDTTFANASLVWTLTTGDQVNVNDQNRTGGPFAATDSPLSAGGDVRLNIPFSLFPLGTTSDDYLFFRATQTESDNGGDEWVVSTEGSTLPPGTLIPEPSAGLLAMAGLLVLSYRRWRTK
jgi:hypothetical protein